MQTTIEYNGRVFAVRHEPDKVFACLELYGSGKTGKEAAKIVGINHWTVMRYVKMAGLTRSRSHRLLLRYNDPNTDLGKSRRRLARRIWQLRGEGLTTYQIADEVGITQRAVCNYLSMEHDPFTYEDRMGHMRPRRQAPAMGECWEMAIEAAAAVTGIPSCEIMGRGRATPVVNARRWTAWAMSHVLGMTPSDIGRRMNRTHSAITNLLNAPMSVATQQEVERELRSRIESIRRAA